MQFLIYGAGALGQALGCMLVAGGHKVDLILRPRFIDILNKKGLHVSGIFGNFQVPPGQLGIFATLKKTAKNYDYTLLTTKAYDTREAIQDIAALEHRAGTIVSMQNGCGNVELLASRFGDDSVLGCRVITGFEINSPGSVSITVSADDIHIGGSQPGNIPASATLLAEIISKAGHPCSAVSDIHSSLFAKLIYNCTLNPLGALLGVNYGKLGQVEETKTVMNSIIEETFAVISALGGNTPWESSKEYMDLFYQELLPATFNHRPSMLQDLENKKPTEIDALTGYVSRQGQQCGIPTPACDVLTRMVKFKELSY